MPTEEDRRFEFIRAEYFQTRTEDTASTTTLIALTSIAVVVVAALLGYAARFRGPLNSTAKIDLSPALWLALPAIPVAVVGWVVLTALQALVRRRYLRELERCLLREADVHLEVQGEVMDRDDPDHKSLVEFELGLPRGAGVVQALVRRSTQDDDGKTSDRSLFRAVRGSRVALYVSILGMLIMTGLIAFIMLISVWGASDAVDHLDQLHRPYSASKWELLPVAIGINGVCFFLIGFSLWTIIRGSDRAWYRIVGLLGQRARDSNAASSTR